MSGTLHFNFVCPKPDCNGTVLQETVTGVAKHTDVDSLEMEGGESVHCNYGAVDYSTDDAELYCFKCKSCGFTPCDAEYGDFIETELGLMVWLKENGMLVE